MNQSNKLEYKIQSLFAEGLALTAHLIENSDERIPSMGEVGEWNYQYLPILVKYFNTIMDNIALLNSKNQDILYNRINEIESQYKMLGQTIVEQDRLACSQELSKLKEIINDLTPLEDLPFTFEYQEDKEYKFMNIVTLIQNNYFTELGGFLNIVNKINREKSNTLNIKALKKISEYSVNSKLSNINDKLELVSDLHEIYHEFMLEKLHYENKNLWLEKKDHEERIKEEYFKLELTKNSELISAFGDQSKDTQTSIQILYFAIFGVFLLILGSIFFKMNDTLNSSQNWNITNLYFLSFILSLSALLTFLIKEKNNLTSKRDYFHKCHVELKALSSYVAGIDTDKVEQLKIDLAPIYFTAGETNNLNNASEPSLSKDQVTQLIDLLKESIKK